MCMKYYSKKQVNALIDLAHLIELTRDYESDTRYRDIDILSAIAGDCLLQEYLKKPVSLNPFMQYSLRDSLQAIADYAELMF